MSDNKNKDICTRLRHGDQNELKRFFDERYSMFVSFALNYIANRHVCEDIVQEAFLEYWDNRGKFNSLVAIRAYIYKIIRHKSLNYLRHQRIVGLYEQQVNEKNIESKSYFLDNILKEEANNIISNSINQLPPMARKVMMLSLEDMSNEEIAQRLGLSMNTVRNHKANAYRH